MPRIQLTDRFCAAAKPRSGDRTAYFDTVTKGLELLAGAKTKTWFFHFVTPAGKRARVKLGSYPATSLAAARGLALEGRSHVEGGKDARHVFASPDASALTVGAFLESYLDKHAPNLRSGQEIARRLKKNVVPKIGAVRLADLHKRDINRVLDPALARGAPIEAARIFADLRAALRWGVARGDLDHCVMEGMRSPAHSKPRERVLSEDEIAKLWKALPTVLPSKQHQRVIQLCLLTGQRLGEVCGMRVDELTLGKAPTWHLPGSRVKNGHAHAVPLSGLALGVIKEAMADAGDDPLVFPGLSAHRMSMAVLRAQDRFGLEHWTAHDLRRTALTGMAKLGVQPVVLGFVANHRTTTKAGVTLSTYVHHAYERETRQALDLWADRLKGIIAGKAAKVVALVRP